MELILESVRVATLAHVELGEAEAAKLAFRQMLDDLSTLPFDVAAARARLAPFDPTSPPEEIWQRCRQLVQAAKKRLSDDATGGFILELPLEIVDGPDIKAVPEVRSPA